MAKEKEEFTPKNRKHWREWLTLNHNREEGLWLIFYKKSSPNFNLSYEDARDEALCFAWIDSTKCKVDEQRFKQYFSPRRKNSGWSAFNKRKMEELIKLGLMTEIGFKAIEKAKENGTYYILDNRETLTLPNELETEFKKSKKAKIIYDQLPDKQKRHIITEISLLRTEKGKREKAKKIINKLIEQSL